MQGQKQYQEKLFLSFQLSDRIPEDNFYRRLKGALDLSFIPQQTSQYYGSEGQKSIDPIVFFKLMLIGYIENLNSDRKIIEHASMRMDMLYFINYDINEALPWHSTLSRTRNLYGEELFLEVFRKVLSLCINKGMVNGRRQAIYSAYIKANASMDSIIPKEVKDDTADYLKELTENEEEQKDKSKTSMSNRNWTSPADPDSRISKKKHKPFQLNYLGHISVDTSSHVICGALADFADKRDSSTLPKIVDQVSESLEREAITIQTVLADTNYSSGKAYRYLENRNIGGYIPCHGAYKPKRDNFTYHREGDYFLCSQGKKLPFKKISIRKCNSRKVYWSSRVDCGNCPLKTECIGKKGFKVLEDTVDKAYYDRMYQRVTSKKGKQMKSTRSATVEPVLGTLLYFVGMKKVNTKGINLANKHVILAATAYNIKKLMKFNPAKKAITIAKTAIKEQKDQIIQSLCHLFWQNSSFALMNFSPVRLS
jgi:transposase